MNEHFDRGSVIVIGITFVLFVTALFVKGIGQELLLEAGVFLVSVKLIMMHYQHSVQNQKILNEIQEIKKQLDKP